MRVGRAADIASAESQLEQAKSSLATLTAGPSEQELAIAQAGVEALRYE